MKYIFHALFFFIVFSLQAQDFPEPMSPPRLVNDFANVLNPEEESALERKLVAFNDSTSTQIAIVFIRSTGGYDIAQYGAELAEKWGVGQADKRNGVLILSAMDDRKVTIQVGYGLEPVVTDAVARLIIEQDIAPNYRQQRYYEGVDRASDQLMQLAVGEFPAELRQALEKRDGGGAAILIFTIIALFILMLFLRGRRRTQYIGSGRGGAIPPIIWGGMLGSGGRRHGGFWGDFSGGGGHFGGGGGGFGGFGGGSFGGGGASGGW